MAVDLGPDGLTLGSTTINDWADVGGGKVLQLVQTHMTSVFSTGSTSFTDVTGLSATITPSSSSSKILVMVNIHAGVTGNTYRSEFRLLRGTTLVGNGVPNSNRNGGIGTGNSGNYMSQNIAIAYLDSPATTSATTYKIQTLSQSGSNSVVNYTGNDADQEGYPRCASQVTLWEIAG